MSRQGVGEGVPRLCYDLDRNITPPLDSKSGNARKQNTGNRSKKNITNNMTHPYNVPYNEFPTNKNSKEQETRKYHERHYKIEQRTK